MQRSAKLLLKDVSNPRLFATKHGRSQVQPRLFKLEEVLGKDGWLKVLRLEDYVIGKRRRPHMLQDVLFSYLDVV